MKRSSPLNFNRVVRIQIVHVIYRLAFVAAMVVFGCGVTPNTADGHTSNDFLPLEFRGFHAPFGFDETETYTEVSGDEGFAYLGSVSSGVAIMNINDPDSITTTAVFGDSLGVAFTDIVVVNGIGFFSSDSQGSYIVDLADASNPTALANVSADNGGLDFITNAIVWQSHLFQVSESSSVIAVFDVSNPSSPVWETNIETNDSVGIYDLSVQGERLYVAGLGGTAGEGAVYIYDLSDLSTGSTALIGQITTGANTASVAASQDHTTLMVTHRETGGTLAAWNISDLASPVLIEAIDASDLDVNSISAANVVRVGSFAYVAWHQAGVQVIDMELLDQTGTIFRTGAFGTSTASPLDGFVGNTSLHVNDEDQVLLADSRWGLYVVDASNVVSPDLIGDFNEDDIVDIDDIDFYSGRIGLTSSDAGFDSQLDWNNNGTIEVEDHDYHVNNFVQTSNGVTGALLGDINLDGRVDVLSDAFGLVARLNGAGPYSFGTADLNADQQVDVLGDAFTLIGNLGQSTD